MQVLALLLALKERAGVSHGPALLVVPASLIANWKAEIDRFAPSLRVLVAHPSEADKPLADIGPDDLAGADLIITTYALTHRLRWLAATEWPLVVLDEAQAIKNPGAKQAQAVKALSARSRVALTGTPVENRLTDLWSLFDFLNPGLLGSAKAFGAFAKQLGERAAGYAPLRELTRPYILRRLKTDRRIIADLPDKTELHAYCGLSRMQAALYQESVKSLADKLEHLDRLGGHRAPGDRPVVSHALQADLQSSLPVAAGRRVGARGEREVLAPARAGRGHRRQAGEGADLHAVPRGGGAAGALPRGRVRAPGLVMHGATPVRQRRDLVERFQDDERLPFFVLSLKVGGTGLNLTAASHVIHFDRWWNPAVEAQATDRAFRIGQKRNVLVHKLVCRGTVEEKIDAMIEAKQGLARSVLEIGGEALLTEMSDAELLRVVSLDLRAALEAA